MFSAGVGIGTLPKAPPVHPLVQPHPFSPFRGQGTPGAASAEQLGRAGGEMLQVAAGASRESISRGILRGREGLNPK